MVYFAKYWPGMAHVLCKLTVSISVSGISGINAGYNKAKGEIKENSTVYNPSSVTAKDTLTLESGKDTNIIGSKASGDTVKVEVGENLNIESLQAQESYDEKNSSSGMGISVDLTKAGKTSIQGSASKGKIESDYESVTDQAGIYAGEGGFDINVGKNTDLKGAVIASDATPDKNKLSTDTLTYSDIQNKAEYKASSIGVGYSSDKGFTPNPGMPVSGDASSTTQSAVSPGTIIVGGKEVNPENLSRDPSGALNALGQIFDKKTVQEQQELAKVFGEVAFTLIGDLAEAQKKSIAKDSANKINKLLEDAQAAQKAGNTEAYTQYLKDIDQLVAQTSTEIAKWSDGGSMKTALHTIAGGLMAELGGGNFAAGALGAGANEALLKAIKPGSIEEAKWASLVIGLAAGKIAGGDATAGAAAAVSGTENNIGRHYTEQQKAIKSAQVQELMAQGMDGVTAMQTVEAQWKEIGVVQGDIYDSAMIKGVGLQVIQAKVAMGIISEDEAAQQMQQQYDSVRKDYPQLTDQQFNAVYSFGLKQGADTAGLVVEIAAMEVGGRLAVKVGSKVIELVRGGQTASNVGTVSETYKVGNTVGVSSAEETNLWWSQRGYTNPPYKPGTSVTELQLTEQTTFVRVYDGEVSGMRGSWLMKAEDIKGLTPAQIKDKFALPAEPKYVVDVTLD